MSFFYGVDLTKIDSVEQFCAQKLFSVQIVFHIMLIRPM